jgi:hypothetical protein
MSLKEQQKPGSLSQTCGRSRWTGSPSWALRPSGSPSPYPVSASRHWHSTQLKEQKQYRAARSTDRLCHQTEPRGGRPSCTYTEAHIRRHPSATTSIAQPTS